MIRYWSPRLVLGDESFYFEPQPGTLGRSAF
jgi:hypothetical protein